MSLTQTVTRLAERAPMPDTITRGAIAFFVDRARRELARGRADDDAFVRDMENRPIAVSTAEANAQHYEVPSAFFRLVLGPRLKYSSCLYATPDATLAEAEERALAAIGPRGIRCRTSESAEQAAPVGRILHCGPDGFSDSVW